jgi:hypothetical protein
MPYHSILVLEAAFPFYNPKYCIKTRRSGNWVEMFNGRKPQSDSIPPEASYSLFPRVMSPKHMRFHPRIKAAGKFGIWSSYQD